MLTPISRSPNDPSGASNAAIPSRVSRGAPPAPLRSAPRRDPADESTLALLGSNPLNDPSASLGNASTGSAGLLLGSLSMVAKGLQGLNAGLPGFVPSEVLMWVDSAMQQIPQIIQQQQSALQSPPGAGPTSPQAAPMMLGPSTQAMAPAPSAAASPMGGMQA